jgi:hypothetical protein
MAKDGEIGFLNVKCNQMQNTLGHMKNERDRLLDVCNEMKLKTSQLEKEREMDRLK